MGADAVDRQQLAATIHHQDGHATRPSEAHGAVGEFDCGEEALCGHGVSLGGESGRLLRQRSVKLCGKHIAQSLCVGIEREREYLEIADARVRHRDYETAGWNRATIHSDVAPTSEGASEAAVVETSLDDFFGL